MTLKTTCYTLILIILLSFNGFTQEKDSTTYRLKFFNKTEGGVSFGLGSFNTDIVNGFQKKAKNDEIVGTLQTVNGIRYNDRWSLGVCVGAEKWREGWFWPVYGYLGYNFKRTENTFFANIYLGYGFGTRDSTSFYQKGTGAFSLIIGVGYRMSVAKNLRFGYEVFYKYQALKTSYYSSITSDTLHPYKQKFDQDIGLNFAGFKILVDFP
jgi:hypothetical protein